MLKRPSTSVGLVIAFIAAASFGTSGAFIKPLLDTGWSPAAAVTFRALIGAVVLLPFTLVALRGRWSALWHARWRVLLMALIGVAATQLVYITAVSLVPISTAILIEYMAPLLLVAFAWARSRTLPKAVVLIGSAVALAGLVLVVGPDGHGGVNVVGLIFACLGAIGCAVYYVIAAKPSEGLPPVALAGSGLAIGGLALGAVGVTGLVPFAMNFGDVRLLGAPAPWWVPLLVVGVVATGIAYAASITASEVLGSRLASFMGLLEVVFAALYAWLLLGQDLTIPQLIGGVLILGGIALVRAEKVDVPIEPGTLTSEIPVVPRQVVGTATGAIDL
ncbi:MAG TPA: DMT family transporter [Galbitalea sp.]|nr:DMT family transporter [Galbitalea sp.]